MAKKKSYDTPHEDVIQLKKKYNYNVMMYRSAAPTENGINGSRIYHLYYNSYDEVGRYGLLAEYDYGWEMTSNEDDMAFIEDLVYEYGWEGYEDMRPEEEESTEEQEEPQRKENHTVPTLKDLRNKESLTIPQMAEIIGKSPSSWRNYENGGKTPDDVYEKLSAHFGISVEDLKAGTWEKVADIPSEEIDGADTPVEEKVTEPEEKPENSLEGFMNEPEEATEDVEPVESGQEAISGMTEYKPEPWVKLKEVAEYLGVDEATCREMAMKGEIPANKIGRGYRFKMSEVKAAVSSTTTTSSTKDTDVTVPTSAEHEDKADEVDKTDKKDVAEKSLSIIIQSVMGGTITVDEIEKRVKVAAPDADTVYVKPEENRAYWTGGGKMGYVVLWE